LRRAVASLLLLLALLPAAPAWAFTSPTEVFLGPSVRQLGLGELDSPREDTERYGAKGVPALLAQRNREYLTVDGVKIYLDDNIGSLRGHLTVTRTDYAKVLVPLYWKTPVAGVRRIVIDPGHGGKDPGKQNPGLRYDEKAATLDTAVRLKLVLEKRGFEVLLTRNRDVAVDLDERAAFANRSKADLFISLHYNGAGVGDTSSSGIETYCLTPAGQKSTNTGKAKADVGEQPGNRFDTPNLLLAWNIQRQILAATGAEDRGVRRARFAVLRPLACPGVLVEGGFISSKREGAQIADAAFRQKIADSVAEGVFQYLQRQRAR
jgi:N-acetylmuramoyl-L-alanine amidase